MRAWYVMDEMMEVWFFPNGIKLLQMNWTTDINKLLWLCFVQFDQLHVADLPSACNEKKNFSINNQTQSAFLKKMCKPCVD